MPCAGSEALGESLFLSDAIALLGCFFLADSAVEDFASHRVSRALDLHFEDLTPHAHIEIQLALMADHVVRLDRIFELTQTPKSRAAATLRRVYSRILQELKEGFPRAEPAGEGLTPLLFAEEEGDSAANRLRELLSSCFHADVITLQGDRPGHYRACRPTNNEEFYLEREPGIPDGTYLHTAGRRYLLPLSPFVTVREGELLLYRGLCEEGILVGSTFTAAAEVSDSSAALRKLADVFLRLGLYRKAVAVIHILKEKHRDSYDYPGALCASHGYLGSRYAAEGKPELAAKEFESAIKYRPDIPFGYYLLCRHYAKQKKLDAAIAVLRRLLDRNPRLDKAHEILGDLYSRRGDVNGAIKMYSRSMLLNPMNRWASEKRLRAVQEARLTRQKGSKEAKPEKEKETGAAPKAKLWEQMLEDLTADPRVRGGDPLVGREQELLQMMEILACREKKNVLILGDPGVGKTALVYELARRMAMGEVPFHLQGKQLLLMNVATLLAGAKFRGQFEERVLELKGELQTLDCILFIDDFHTIVNAGLTKGGTLDTSNLLKPALIRGEIQSIGATTFDDYRTNVEKDPSLVRCFQILTMEEPSARSMTEILDRVTRRLEDYHKVRFVEEAVADTLPLIERCLQERALPDKAIGVLDRAAAKAMLAFQRDPEAAALCARQDILVALSDLSGIPAAKLAGQGTAGLLEMEDQLGCRVVGQDEAIAQVARVLRASRLKLELKAERPDGVFLFIGPTGVGKTELARALAELLFGDEDKLIRIDMSEFQERISGSRLIGTSPGYVGYNDQNQLTDQVRRNPYSLVLLDEIEKADGQLMNLFLQVFDAGRLTDGKGRTVHFGNATIVMTSNVGTELYARTALGYGGEGEGVSKSRILRELKRVFPPEFLNRVDEIVVFNPLSQVMVKEVARLQFRELRDRLKADRKEFAIALPALTLLAEEGFDAEYGARNLQRTIRRLVLEPLADQVAGMPPSEWAAVRLIQVSASAGQGIRVRLLPCGEPFVMDDAAPPVEAEEAG